MSANEHIWYLSAADSGRQRLFAPGLIALFALAMLLVGWLALPERNLHERLSRAEHSSTLTVAYLRAWLSADRSDWRLRLTLARHETLLGQYESARAGLEQVIADGPTALGPSARRLRLNVLEAQAYALQPGDPRRVQLLALVRSALSAAAADLSHESELRAMLRRAMALEHHVLARSLTTRIARLVIADVAGLADGGERAQALAQSAIALGDFRLAAELYWEAFDHARSIERRRALLMLVARAEVSGNRLGLFFEALETRIDPNVIDRMTAAKLARLALSAGRLDLADRFARRMLSWRVSPGDTLDSIIGWLARLSPISSAYAREQVSRTGKRVIPGKRQTPAARLSTDPYSNYDSALERSPSIAFEPKASYDAEHYGLGFDVFIAQGKLDDAWGVARAAVEQQPDSVLWRLRLAQTSEWSQRPRDALAQRLYLARHATPADARTAWAEVERLAEALRDAPVLLEFLYWADAHGAAQPASALRIVATLEMLGEAERAAHWLEGRIAQTELESPESLLDLLVDLQERRGDHDGLVRAVDLADTRHGASPSRAVRIARHYYRLGQIEKAFAAIERARERAESDINYNARAERETEYWGNYATLASTLHRPDDAIRAYRRLLSLEVYDVADIEAMATLIEARSPLAATAILIHGKRRFEAPALTRRGLLTALRANRFDVYERLWMETPPAARDLIEADADFLKQRAAAELGAGKLVRAIIDYRRAGDMLPHDHELKAGLMWALLAKRDARALRGLLQRWNGLSQTETSLWGPFGAAWMALDEPGRALPYFVRQAREKQDYLWWLAYADGLSAVGRVDAAWSLRHKAWTQLRKQADQAGQDTPHRRERIVALAMQFGPADGARSLLRELVRERAGTKAPNPATGADVMAATLSGAALVEQLDRLLEPTPPSGPDLQAGIQDSGNLRAAANELMLSYLLSEESFDSAQGWLLSRYAGDLAQPAWARLSIALASNDRDGLNNLLQTMPEWLPKLDRVEALERTGQHAAAQTLAFDTFASRPDSAAAHQRFVDTVVERASSVEVGHQRLVQPAIETISSGIELDAVLNEKTRLIARARSARIDRRDASLLGVASVDETELALGVRLTAQDDAWEMIVGRRASLADRTSVRMTWEHRFADQTRTSLVLAVRERTDASAALRMGGERSHLSARASMPVTPRDVVGAAMSIERYASQLGTQTARGTRVVLDYSHHWRRAYPDLGARVALSHSNYRHSLASDSLISRLAAPGNTDPARQLQPDGSTQLSLGLQFGESARVGFGGKIKPFADVGLHLNSVSGSGYELRVGLRAAPLGKDRLLLQLAAIDDPSSRAGSTREIGLSYEYPF